MALSATEKSKILNFLGWPQKTLDSTGTHYNSIVNSRLTNLTAEAEALVKGLLARIQSVYDQMDAALCRLTTSKVGDITLNNEELAMLKKEYMRRIRELSDALDIKVDKSGLNPNISIVV